MPGHIDTRYFQFFTNTSALDRTERGIQVEVDEELLRVDVIRDDVIRLKMSRGRTFDEEPTFATCADLSVIPKFTIAETAKAVRVSTRKMSVVIGKAPFLVDAYRSDGTVIMHSDQTWDGQTQAYGTLNDEFVVTRGYWAEDAIFGLGEKTGRFNRKGRDFILWNTDVLNPHATFEFTGGSVHGDPAKDPASTVFDPYYISIPFFYRLDYKSGATAGFFVDNGYRGHFEFSDPTRYRFHFTGGQYTEYVFAGPRMKDILEGYTWLTGRVQPPPLWALGHHQCRWYRYTQEDLLQIARHYRETQIPCDALWLDIDYMDGYRVFTWNRALFPNPQGMLAQLKADGFRVITIIDPGVKAEKGYEVFDDGARRKLFCRTEGGAIYTGQVWPGKTAFPDFAREAARTWWGKRNAAHVRSGLAGIWNDMNEPATGAIGPNPMRFDRARYPHARYHNQYALLMAMGTVEGLRQAMPTQRSFVLSRAGFAGIQRYAANWMGDNRSRWDHLQMSLPMAMGMGVSGQAFVGADVGGFAEDCSPELLARWYQYGALTPFFRNHASQGTIDQYPWSFGETVERVCREAISLRYRLLPYIYSAFLRTTETGEPVQKPLVFAFQDDHTARDIDDEYLLGEHLLVAPIYMPGAISRQVYLPKGTWHHWHTGEISQGQQFIRADPPMATIPLFARGGAIVPMWPTTPLTTMNYQPKTVDLHIFIPEDDGETHSMLHEDDGLTLAFRDDAYYRTAFVLTRKGKTVTLTASVGGKGYPEFRRQWFHLVFHGAVNSKVVVHGAQASLNEGRLIVPNAGEDFALSGTVP